MKAIKNGTRGCHLGNFLRSSIRTCKLPLRSDQRFEGILSPIVEELTQVMQAEEIACSFDGLEASVKQVIQATAQNNSSMKQDMFYQRKTEIDFITGHLIKTALKHQIEVPVNQKLFDQVKEQENSWNHQD